MKLPAVFKPRAKRASIWDDVAEWNKRASAKLGVADALRLHLDAHPEHKQSPLAQCLALRKIAEGRQPGETATPAPMPPAVRPLAVSTSKPASASIDARIAELEAAHAKEQAAHRAALVERDGKIADLAAQLTATNKRLAEIEPTIEARASVRAQEILAACGGPAIHVRTKGNPASAPKPGDGKTGLAKVIAETGAQVNAARQQSSIIIP